MHIRMYLAEQRLTMQEALEVVRNYVNSKGAKTVSDLPVNEVWNHAIEICRLLAVKTAEKGEVQF
jgi:uncharacterized protein (DUF302 family)